jgi:ketosteroid isomerase-like protein
MARVLRAAAAVSLFAGVFFGLQADPAVETAERGWATGITKPDFALLEKVLSDDLIYTHSDGRRDSKASYIKSLRDGSSKYVSVDYEKLESKVLDRNNAIVVARAKVKVVNNGEPRDLVLSLLHVFVRKGGQWQLVAHQSARMP